MRYVFSGLYAIAQVPRPIAHSHPQRVHETLDRINRNDTANCTSAPGGKERIEMGVALVKRLHRSSSDAMQDTAGFGRGLHEQCALQGMHAYRPSVGFTRPFTSPIPHAQAQGTWVPATAS